MNKFTDGKPVASTKESGTTSDKDVPPVRPTDPSNPSSLWVVRDIADTTWRMTVPVVIFTFIGIFADLQLDTKPWLTFVGVVIGFYFAIVLIKQQINRSKDQP